MSEALAATATREVRAGCRSGVEARLTDHDRHITLGADVGPVREWLRRQA